MANDPPEFERFVSGSRPLDVDGIDWDAIPRHPLDDDVLRVLAYMQDVESHTVVFPRTFFSKRALADEYVGPFLVCWLYEEGMHGRALSRFLEQAGHPIPTRARSRVTLHDRVDQFGTAILSSVWKDFLALHMTWGAIHECTTIHAYRRMVERSDHPVLNELLNRIIRDEARHYAFYMWQAQERLASPRVARAVRRIIEWFYVPVGVKHQPDALARWVSAFLFDGDAGRRAAREVDANIAKLPGFSGAVFLGRWLERNVYGG